MVDVSPCCEAQPAWSFSAFLTGVDICSLVASVAQANLFARDTGHSVAVFSVGGMITDIEDTEGVEQSSYIATVKNKDNTLVAPNLKTTVLKYGTGGVSKQLVGRIEIVKFISARGNKALADMYIAANNNGVVSA